LFKISTLAIPVYYWWWSTTHLELFSTSCHNTIMFSNQLNTHIF
jgi:hypothetical protein